MSSEPEPPKKRQRCSTPRQDPSYGRQILLEELDLEIALRQRLASTVESRITWALALQEALARDVHGIATGNTNEYRSAALDALETIELPCDPIFTRDVCRTQLRPVQAPAAAVPPTPQTDAPAIIPQSTYSTRNRGLPRATRPLPRKLLFLRNTATTPPQVAKLACPDCSRTDFSSLQGLLNHCRLSHKREFGSHDECVQCCAVLVEGAEEQAQIVTSGTEVGGITIPGLRRLFEIAVGGGTRAAPLLPPKKPEPLPVQVDVSAHDTTSRKPSVEAASDPAHVTKTLGYHANTPALAQFLGRAPAERCIHSYDENEPVDIFGSGSSMQKESRWRMPYTHRNKARASLDVVVEPSAPAVEPAVEPTPQPGPATAHVLSGPVSRFHVMARVSIRDLSMWIPLARRIKSREDHTHRWRLEVSAPSYSLPISSFLTKMTVRSATDPPPSTLVDPITVDKAPFVVTSTADKPFLAQITLTWVGSDGLNPPMEIEHWVELDPLRLGQAVRGEEQVFDIALDRATELHPAEHEVPRSISWEVDNIAGEETQTTPDAEDEAEPDYSVRLRSLLAQFPLTSRDGRGRSSRRIPYTLVATPAQFRSLVYGRQKAIEWARARALRDAYEEACVEEPWSDGRTDIVLTTGDVFRWLEDEGQFLRKVHRPVVDTRPVAKAKEATVKTEPHEPPEEEYCRNCGLHYSRHPGVGGTQLESLDGVKQEEPGTSSLAALALNCSSFNSAQALDVPVWDVNRLLSSSSSGGAGAPHGLSPALFAAPPPWGESSAKALSDTTHRDLATAAEPDVVRAIQTLATRWRLDRLRAPWPTDVPGFGACSGDGDGAGGAEEKHGAQALGASAMLALAVRCFSRMLVRSGVAEFRRDEAGLRGSNAQEGGAAAQRLLTPAHVVRGVLHDAPTVAGCGAVLLAMAPLGMSLPTVVPVDPEA